MPGGQQVEQHPGTDDEHPGVPAVGAGGEISPGHLDRRLLHELLDHERPVVTGERRTLADVAEGGGREGRPDADGDQPVVGRDLRREGHGTVEGLAVADHVVGGERRHHRVRVLTFEQRRGIADRRHRVAGRRLGDDPDGREVGQLGDHLRAMGGAGHHQHPLSGGGPDPVDRLLEQRAPGTGQVVQELRGRRPRQRPETRAGAAGRHHGPEVVDQRHGGHPRVTA